jgi:hypothetical protein
MDTCTSLFTVGREEIIEAATVLRPSANDPDFMATLRVVNIYFYKDFQEAWT